MSTIGGINYQTKDAQHIHSNTKTHTHSTTMAIPQISLSPRSRKNGAIPIPPFTAPRSSSLSQDGGKVAAVTPENQLEIVDSTTSKKTTTRRVKRGTSSKSQSNAGKKGLKGVSTGE
jgi:hypothetical protein